MQQQITETSRLLGKVVAINTQYCFTQFNYQDLTPQEREEFWKYTKFIESEKDKIFAHPMGDFELNRLLGAYKRVKLNDELLKTALNKINESHYGFMQFVPFKECFGIDNVYSLTKEIETINNQKELALENYYAKRESLQSRIDSYSFESHQNAFDVETAILGDGSHDEIGVDLADHAIG